MTVSGKAIGSLRTRSRPTAGTGQVGQSSRLQMLAKEPINGPDIALRQRRLADSGARLLRLVSPRPQSALPT
jgi:hypothetical protein